MKRFIFAGLVLVISTVLAQEGYNYEPPAEEDQLKPGVAAVEAEIVEAGSGSLAQGQGQEQGGHGHDSDDPLAWLRDSVPGEPGVDYPIYQEAPESSFVCEGRADGMYADIEAECQPWHQCLGDRQWTFLCPNGTIFNQEIFTCVWWFDFDCETAEDFFSLNEGLYETAGGDGGSTGAGGDGDGEGAASGNELPAEAVIVEEGDYDEVVEYEEEGDLSGYEEEGAGSSGPDPDVAGPISVIEPAGLYGAPGDEQEEYQGRQGRQQGRQGRQGRQQRGRGGRRVAVRRNRKKF